MKRGSQDTTAVARRQFGLCTTPKATKTTGACLWATQKPVEGLVDDGSCMRRRDSRTSSARDPLPVLTTTNPVIWVYQKSQPVVRECNNARAPPLLPRTCTQTSMQQHAHSNDNCSIRHAMSKTH